MAQKVVTARKMKSRQETTSSDNKRQAFINTDTRRFKIQTGDMGPPPPPPLEGPLVKALVLKTFEFDKGSSLFRPIS